MRPIVLLLMGLDALDSLPDYCYLLGLLIGDLYLELLLEPQDEFDNVPGMGSQVLYESGLACDLILTHTESFYANCATRSSTPMGNHSLKTQRAPR